MKYSVVLPTLNGGDHLKDVIQQYLKFKREDIEFIVSDNLSDDGTFEFLSSINDSRFKIIQPHKRLTLNQHLDFAYKYATGEWQSHIGDDDILISNNFEIKDFLINTFNCEVFKFNHYRYHWPSELNNFEGQIDDYNFKLDIQVFNANDFYKYMLSQKRIGGGSAWLVKKSIKEKVINKIGYYAAENVEFFSSRASCFFAEKVCSVDAPIYIMGRSPKSSGSQVFQKRSSRKLNLYKESFEWKNRLEFSPFPTRTVASISLNASLNCFSKLKTNYNFDWSYWVENIIHDYLKLKKRGQSSHSILSEVFKGFIYGMQHRHARANISILSWLLVFIKLPLIVLKKLFKISIIHNNHIKNFDKFENIFNFKNANNMTSYNLKSISELSEKLKLEINKDIQI